MQEIKYVTCPRCHRDTLNKIKIRNALSRVDNETYVCSECGLEEAFIDAGMMNLLPEGAIQRHEDFKCLLA